MKDVSDGPVATIRRRFGHIFAGRGLVAFGLTSMPGGHSLAQYNSITGRIFYLDSLNDRDYVLAILHELVHAYLHAPSPDNKPSDIMDESEERLAHYVARLVSCALGIAGYVAIMAAKGVPHHLLTDVPADSLLLAEEIFTFLEEECNSDSEELSQWPQ